MSKEFKNETAVDGDVLGFESHGVSKIPVSLMAKSLIDLKKQAKRNLENLHSKVESRRKRNQLKNVNKPVKPPALKDLHTQISNTQSENIVYLVQDNGQVQIAVMQPPPPSTSGQTPFNLSNNCGPATGKQANHKSTSLRHPLVFKAPTNRNFSPNLSLQHKTGLSNSKFANLLRPLVPKITSQPNTSRDVEVVEVVSSKIYKPLSQSAHYAIPIATSLPGVSTLPTNSTASASYFAYSSNVNPKRVIITPNTRQGTPNSGSVSLPGVSTLSTNSTASASYFAYSSNVNPKRVIISPNTRQGTPNSGSVPFRVNLISPVNVTPRAPIEVSKVSSHSEKIPDAKTLSPTVSKNQPTLLQKIKETTFIRASDRAKTAMPNVQHRAPTEIINVPSHSKKIPDAKPSPNLPKSQPTSVQKIKETTVKRVSDMVKATTINTSQNVQPAKADDSSSNLNTPTTSSNKTFPSLVVVAKPCLHGKQDRIELKTVRSELDAKMKSLLVYTPQKFTEWLMQRGLVLINHHCQIHTTESSNEPYQFNLGMYTGNNNKHSFSGGYIWVGECCGRDKEVSVFKGSIFENTVHPPVVLLKLIYHWCCQSNPTSVLQWINEVSSYYLKNFYTLIRSVCVASLHEKCPVLGGLNRYVEIGIITVTTKGANSTKVEILGAFDPTSKIIRLRVVDPKNKQLRITQLLWSLNQWINKESNILIDYSIDKCLLEDVGFKKIIQPKMPNSAESATQKPSCPTNINVMNYLKQIIPKMFDSTFSFLSTELIQQFLDELSWREMWGKNCLATFDNMINDLVEMTKWNTGDTLIQRLNKISLDPFGDWSYNRHLPKGIDMLPLSITQCGKNPGFQATFSPGQTNKKTIADNDKSNQRGKGYFSPDAVLSVNSTPSSKENSPGSDVQVVKVKSAAAKRSSNVNATSELVNVDSDKKRKLTNDMYHYLTVEPKNLVLQSHYYATAKCAGECLSDNTHTGLTGGHLKCPVCMQPFITNKEIMPHMYRHVVFPGSRVSSNRLACDYCLKDFSTKQLLDSHIGETHDFGRSNVHLCCRICHTKFPTEGIWIIHMWQYHEEMETPYACEICEFRSSIHKDTIDHFYECHRNGDKVVCPLCLKTMTVRNLSCVKQIVEHVKNHNLRRSKKCLQCTLTFLSEVECRQHVANAHHRQPKLEYERYKLMENETPCYMPKPPKIKTDIFHHISPKRPRFSSGRPLVSTGPYTLQSFNVELFCEDKAKCLECKEDLKLVDHFIGHMNCNKCRFATCCSNSMKNHQQLSHRTEPRANIKIHGLHFKSVNLLESAMRCECEFSSNNPDKMAEHLVQCDKSTAFPNMDSVVHQ